jgi:hypothetical protein
MEAAGQRGGENVTGNIALQTTRGANLGGINQTEMNNLAALQKAIADLNAEQPLKEQSVQQQLQSEQAQALMDAQKYGLDYAMKMADLTGNVEVAPGVSMPTLQAQQYQSNRALQEAGLTGTYNGQQTMQSKQFDLQAESQNIENEMNRIQMQMLQDPNSPENQMNSVKLQQMQFELQQAQELAKYAPEEAALKIKQIKAQIAATNRSNQPSQPDKPGLSYTGYYNQLRDMIKEEYPTYYVDSEGKREVINQTPKYSKEDIIQKIRELPLEPEEKAQLANDLGL